MANMDLYDDLFLEENSRQDATTTDRQISNDCMLTEKKNSLENKIEEINDSNENLRKEIAVLKKENKNWRVVYMDVSKKLDISKKNVSTLLKTTRNEIRRKNKTISDLKKELDNILFKRALKSGTVKELRDMIGKIHDAFQTEITDDTSIQSNTLKKAAENKAGLENTSPYGNINPFHHKRYLYK